jgi:hypothetical protein
MKNARISINVFPLLMLGLILSANYVDRKIADAIFETHLTSGLKKMHIVMTVPDDGPYKNHQIVLIDEYFIKCHRTNRIKTLLVLRNVIVHGIPSIAALAGVVAISLEAGPVAGADQARGIFGHFGTISDIELSLHKYDMLNFIDNCLLNK